MTDRELMQEALETFEAYASVHQWINARSLGLMYALRNRLAQPEPEPVAWHEPGAYGNVTTHKDWALANGWEPLYKERI